MGAIIVAYAFGVSTALGVIASAVLICLLIITPIIKESYKKGYQQGRATRAHSQEGEADADKTI